MSPPRVFPGLTPSKSTATPPRSKGKPKAVRRQAFVRCTACSITATAWLRGDVITEVSIRAHRDPDGIWHHDGARPCGGTFTAYLMRPSPQREAARGTTPGTVATTSTTPASAAALPNREVDNASIS